MHKELTYRSCSPRCHPRRWCPVTHTGAVAQRQDTKSQHNKTPPTARGAVAQPRPAEEPQERATRDAFRLVSTSFRLVSTLPGSHKHTLSLLALLTVQFRCRSRRLHGVQNGEHRPSL